MPNPLDALRRLLPPQLAPLSPEEQAAQDARATEIQSHDPSWQQVARQGFEGLMQTGAGLAGFDTTTHTPEGGAKEWSPNGVGQLLGAILPFKSNIKGLYSRVNRVAEELPNAIHANALASKLKNQASSEEVGFRQLGDFLATHADQRIPKAEVIAHLEAHPAPEVNVKSSKVFDPRVDDITPDTPFTPKFEQYTLPGGANYREDLLTLGHQHNADLSDADFHDWYYKKYGARHTAKWAADTPATLDQVFQNDPDLLAEYGTDRNEALNGPSFTQGHYDEPNVLVHVRHNERTLPPELPSDWPYDQPLEKSGDVYTQRDQEGNLTVADPGRKGRFLEEVQSDWHQKGKREGYQLPPEQDAAMEAEYRALIEQNHATLSNHVGRPDFNMDEGNAAVQHLLQNDPEYRARVARATDLETHLNKHDRGVPDAPFKDTWPDLALKQQLLDVANRPDLNWIGHTTGATQADRYDLSQELKDVVYHYDPESHSGQLIGYNHDGQQVIQHQVEPENLPDYIGKEGADRLLRSVEEDNTATGGTMTHALRGADLHVGGEGMRSFYDETLPNKLQKLLTPFGGAVEQGTLPGGKMEEIEALPARSLGRVETPQGSVPRGYTSTIHQGLTHIADTWPPVPFSRGAIPEATAQGMDLADAMRKQPHLQPKGVPMWYANLSPDMKAAIVKKGFPLLTLGGLYAASPQPQDQER